MLTVVWIAGRKTGDVTTSCWRVALLYRVSSMFVVDREQKKKTHVVKTPYVENFCPQGKI
jgi:hypothetical protein